MMMMMMMKYSSLSGMCFCWYHFNVFTLFFTFTFSKEVNMVALVLVTCVASYNGASFYIDVFSHKYQASLKDNE